MSPRLPDRPRVGRSGAAGYSIATVPPVQRDLSDDHWNGVEEGELTAPTDVVYSRRTTRMKRKDAASLMATGCPVVTYWPVASEG
jgi:hypothetical protein